METVKIKADNAQGFAIIYKSDMKPTDALYTAQPTPKPKAK